MKPKVTKQGNEVVYSGVVNQSITPEPFSLIAQFTENPNTVQLCAFFHLGGADFINSSNNLEMNKAAKSWLEGFSKETTRTNFQRELDVENKILRKLSIELQDLIESESKALAKIEKARLDSTNKKASLRQSS